MTKIGAAKFKEQCLAILDHLDPEGVIITKHGRPVAKLIPCQEPPSAMIGRLCGKIEVRGDIFSTGLDWESDAKP